MISKAVRKAYSKFHSRNHDTLYLCVDIHDTIAESNYTGISYNFYKEAIEALKFLSTLKEIRIILYSCCYEKEHPVYVEELRKLGVRVDYFNENPEIPNTLTGCFDKKFYFDILIDDKAGFDYLFDWEVLVKSIVHFREKYAKNI